MKNEKEPHLIPPPLSRAFGSLENMRGSGFADAAAAAGGGCGGGCGGASSRAASEEAAAEAVVLVVVSESCVVVFMMLPCFVLVVLFIAYNKKRWFYKDWKNKVMNLMTYHYRGEFYCHTHPIAENHPHILEKYCFFFFGKRKLLFSVWLFSLLFNCLTIG